MYYLKDKPLSSDYIIIIKSIFNFQIKISLTIDDYDD